MNQSESLLLPLPIIHYALIMCHTTTPHCYGYVALFIKIHRYNKSNSKVKNQLSGLFKILKGFAIYSISEPYINFFTDCTIIVQV